MQKNMQMMMKRISELKQMDRNPYGDNHNNQQILILSQIAHLKRFKYENISYQELRHQIQNSKMFMAGIQENIKHKLMQKGIFQQAQSIMTAIQLYSNVTEILVQYLNRSEEKFSKVNFIEEKKNRLCPICQMSIEENKLNIVRKYVNEAKFSALSLVQEPISNQQQQIHQDDINPNMEDDQYKRTVDKMLSNKKTYLYKASHTSTVLEETFKMNFEKSTQLINITFSQKDIKSANDAMQYAMSMLNSSFKTQMIQHIVPILSKLISRFLFCQKQKQQQSFSTKEIQTDDFNGLKQLKKLEQKAELLHKNLYYKQNQCQQLKKTLKKVEMSGKNSIEENESEIEKLRKQNFEYKDAKKQLQMQVMKLQQQVAKLQKHLQSLQILEARRSSKRNSLRLEQLSKLMQMNKQDQINESGNEGINSNQSQQQQDNQISSGNIKKNRTKKNIKRIKQRQKQKQEENKKEKEKQNNNKTLEKSDLFQNSVFQIKQDTEKQKQILNSKMIKGLSKVNLLHYNKNKASKNTDQNDIQPLSKEDQSNIKIKHNQNTSRSELPSERFRTDTSNNPDDAQYDHNLETTQAQNLKSNSSSKNRRKCEKQSQNFSSRKKQNTTEMQRQESEKIQNFTKEVQIISNDNDKQQQVVPQDQLQRQQKYATSQDNDPNISHLFQNQNQKSSSKIFQKNPLTNCQIQQTTRSQQQDLNGYHDTIDESHYFKTNNNSMIYEQKLNVGQHIFNNEQSRSHSQPSQNQSFMKSMNMPAILMKKIAKHSRYPSSTNLKGGHEQSTNIQTMYSSPLPSNRQSKIFKLFTSKDLNQLFGSVEQAYHFESFKIQTKIKISNNVKQFILDVYKHVSHLKKSNHQLYNWIKNFLKFPYQTAINNNSSTDLSSNMSDGAFQTLFGRILSLHSKCKNLSAKQYCQHVANFLMKIKYKENDKEKTSIILPSIKKR